MKRTRVWCFTGNWTVKQAARTMCAMDAAGQPLDDLAAGYLLGLLAGEGHFGGDGRQAQVTLRMHTRHEQLFRWLEATVPGSRLYGPYTHGGRAYYQWMVRGRALRETLAPLVAAHLNLLDDYVAGRFLDMCSRYGVPLPGGGMVTPTTHDITDANYSGTGS